MIPPMSSSTMNADALSPIAKKNSNAEVGRQEKPDNEKSDKTL